MAVPTNYYVDPAAGVDTTGGGAGGVSAPWLTTQYALNHITRDATNGDQINIKAGAADTLAATLSLATYGTPAVKQPLIFRGYTSAAGDGGIGDINGGALNATILTTSALGVYFADMKLHNTGTAAIVAFSNGKNGLYRCELYDSTGGGITSANTNAMLHVRRCYLHDITGVGIGNAAGRAVNCDVRFTYFKNGSVRKFTDAFYMGGFCTCMFSVFNLSGTSSGIHFDRTDPEIMLNSFYGGGSTGKGIYCDDGTNDHNAVIENNYVEGFSGAGGKCVSFVSGSKVFTYGGNYFFNNTTSEAAGLLGDIYVSLGTGNTVGASAFTNAAGEDFSVGTALKALGLPASFLGGATNQYLDVGGAQRQEAGGGAGGLRRIGMNGGF